MNREIIVIRGGGDLATGVIQKFYRSGYRVLVLETDHPTAVRRTVSLCQAVYDGETFVEQMHCKRIDNLDEADHMWEKNIIPLYLDPDGMSIQSIKPICVIDAIIAKKNIGTHRQMAPITIGIGPGFIAGIDVDIVIETMRGHDLGRLIFQGSAIPNTGIPGEVAGKSTKRVIYTPNSGIIRHIKNIGDIVKKGEFLFTVGETDVNAPFDGVLRGLIQNGFHARQNLKVADIDPREHINPHTISDKARAIGGGALEAYLYLMNIQKNG